jgi:hypothetical protein
MAAAGCLPFEKHPSCKDSFELLLFQAMKAAIAHLAQQLQYSSSTYTCCRPRVTSTDKVLWLSNRSKLA